jgi:hypothetical protein
VRRPALTAVALAVLLVALPGCGVMIDGFYLASSRRYSETADEARPTAEQRTAVEYAAVVEPDGRLLLTCARRTRTVERAWSVTRTYQRRGGFDRGTYAGAAVVSGLIGAIVGVTIGAACAQDDLDYSCWNLVYAAPFALDIGYSLVRYATVPPAKLVDKHSGGERLRFGAVVSEEPASCEAVDRVALGGVSGPSDEDALNGFGLEQTARLGDGAVELPVEPDGGIVLAAAPDAVRAWAGSSWMRLWVVEGDGAPRPVEVDRCAALRPHAFGLAGPELATYRADCAPPPP